MRRRDTWADRRARLRAAEEEDILHVLAVDDARWFPRDIGIEARLRPARLYAALDRLVGSGHVAVGWLTGDPRPRRRWYRITDAGRVAVRGGE